jgi:hypothetical protein
VDSLEQLWLNGANAGHHFNPSGIEGSSG